MYLIEVVDNLNSFDEADTIYAARPWTSHSQAIVAPEPSSGLPPEAVTRSLVYFLEINVAREFVGGWAKSFADQPTPEAICDRLIQYAVNDA
jgi:hypothetical protein